MKHLIRYLLLCGLLALPAAVFSQGSGSMSAPTMKGSGKSGGNFVVTRSVRGVVTSAAPGSVRIKLGNGKTTSLRVTGSTRITRGCLAVGRRVTATYRSKDRRATVIRCSLAKR